jgi:hypothetical protein
VSKPTSLDLMLLADGEVASSDALGPDGGDPDSVATIAAVTEMGDLVRGALELATDDAEPRLAGLWDLVERRLDHDDAQRASSDAALRAAKPSGSSWRRLWNWLTDHRSHVLTGLVSAGAVAALALALRPTPAERIVVKTVAVPAVPPTVLAHTPPEVESLEVTGGTGTGHGGDLGRARRD